VVVEKLKLFPQELERRRQIAAIYDRRLANHVDPQSFGPGCESGYGLYTVAIDRRDEVQARLKADGVPTAVYYSQPLHRMAAFRAFAGGERYPQSERLAERVLSLPMHPYLTDDQAGYVADRLIEALED
jgi:UDP-2-acetamido-2-deoxy-ribo-hexuluronate aminotransferase